MRRLLLLFLTLTPMICLAQDPYYKRIDDADGLPNNSVYGLFQDSKGFIWITTDDGLCRYDGHSFKSYSSLSQSSKAGSNIFEDPLHRIWYENFDGQMYRVSGDTVVGLFADSLHGYVRAGHLGRFLLVPSNFKVEVYDLITLQRLAILKNGNSTFGVTGMPGETKYWLYAGPGHQSIDGQLEIHQMPQRTNSGDTIQGIAFDYGGREFVFRYDSPKTGIWTVSGDHLEKFAPLHGEGMVQTHAFGNGKIWICYVRGVEVIDAQTGRQQGGHIYFPDKSISAFLIDREGNHWFGTQNEGLMMVPDFISARIPAPGAGLKRLLQTRQGLIAASQDGRLLAFDSAKLGFSDLLQVENRHSIDFMMEDGSNLLVGAPAANICSMKDWKIKQTADGGIKDAVRISPRYLAVSLPGTSGLLRLETGNPDASDPWDQLAARFPNLLNPDLSDLCVGRGRAVAYKPGRKAIYFATSTGLMRATPETLEELKWKGRTVYGSQLQGIGDHI